MANSIAAQKRSLLAAGDTAGLIALNHSCFGAAEMMARGYSAFADVMRRTADGRDIGDLYAELQAVTDLQNEQRQNFLSLFTSPTTSAVTSVLQTNAAPQDVWQEASEYGVPTGSRIAHDVLDMGSTFKWYDAGWKMTWQYLADASAAEVAANANHILAADTEHVFNEVMRTVFSPDNRKAADKQTGAVYDVFAFANGDGWTPPDYAGNSFPGSHTHFRTTGSTTLTSDDLDEVVDDFKSHGLSAENGTQIVVFVNPLESGTVTTFRVAAGARSDFVPASGARFYSEGQLVGDQPDATFAGFPVLGSYGDALVIETSRIPAGYVVGLASGGALSPTNPIMFRTHPRFPGLTLVEGANNKYPLLDSYWVRGMGTGVRQRCAGMVLQLKAGTYTPPGRYS